MNDMRTRAAEIWGQLAPWQRFATLVVLISTVGLASVLSLWMREPNYALLYRNLGERDAAAVVNELESQRIPYRLVGDGTSIEVPANLVADARLKLATKNLPQGGAIGFELFDGGALDSFGLTEFMQRVNYQRALEGELGRTITAMEGVEVARVHLAIPEESLFVEDQKPPTASVILKTVPGVRLSPSQIQAIRFLTANSVEGLQISNISVVDVDGNVYEAPKTDAEMEAALVSSNQISVQRRYELDTESRLQAMLDQTLGPNKSVVRVSVDMNWDREESTQEIYAPAGEVGSVVRSSNQIEESWTGAAAPNAEGVPGVDPNAPPELPSYQSNVGGSGEYSRRDVTTNYEVSKEVRSVVRQPGAVKRISVAVLLDDTLPPEQVQTVQALVETAVGMDIVRGDQVTVQQIAFNNDFYAQEAALLAEMERRDLYMRVGTIVAILLGLVAVLLFIRKIFGDMQKQMMPYILEEPVPALPGGQPLASLQQGAAAAYLSTEEASVEPPPLPPPDQSEMRMRALARHNPEIIASILRDWIESSDTPGKPS